jgi:hypothetical protein
MPTRDVRIALAGFFPKPRSLAAPTPARMILQPPIDAWTGDPSTLRRCRGFTLQYAQTDVGKAGQAHKMSTGKINTIRLQKIGIPNACLGKTIFSTTADGPGNRPYNRELWRRFELSHFFIA